MKRLVITTAALLALSLTPALAAGCCGKGQGMCAKSTSSMTMKSGKKGCCCDKMAKKMDM